MHPGVYPCRGVVLRCRGVVRAPKEEYISALRDGTPPPPPPKQPPGARHQYGARSKLRARVLSGAKWLGGDVAVQQMLHNHQLTPSLTAADFQKGTRERLRTHKQCAFN